jgi:hypothetical protein
MFMAHHFFPKTQCPEETMCFLDNPVAIFRKRKFSHFPWVVSPRGKFLFSISFYICSMVETRLTDGCQASFSTKFCALVCAAIFLVTGGYLYLTPLGCCTLTHVFSWPSERVSSPWLLWKCTQCHQSHKTYTGIQACQIKFKISPRLYLKKN